MENSTPPENGQKETTDVPQNATLREATEAGVLQRVISDISGLPVESRKRIIDTVCTFFDLGHRHSEQVSHQSTTALVPKTFSQFRFSESEVPTPKQFMLDKNPQTDVERVACLAFYLTHYKSQPHFKTKDIGDLNTDAAHRRFSNAAMAVVNATNSGYLVPSVKGCKQLSASGEQYVQALPDREAARTVLERMKPRRSGRNSRERSNEASND